MGKNDLNDSKIAPAVAYIFFGAVVLGVIAMIFDLEELGIACAIVIAIILGIGIIFMLFNMLN